MCRFEAEGLVDLGCVWDCLEVDVCTFLGFVDLGVGTAGVTVELV